MKSFESRVQNLHYLFKYKLETSYSVLVTKELHINALNFQEKTLSEFNTRKYDRNTAISRRRLIVYKRKV